MPATKSVPADFTPPSHSVPAASASRRSGTSHLSVSHGSKWRGEDPSSAAPSSAPPQKPSPLSKTLRSVMGYGFWSGVAISTLLWCLVAAMLVYRVEFGGPSLEEASAAVTGVLTPPVGLRAVVKAVVAQRQLVGPGAPPTLAQVERSASAAPSPARMPPALPGSRSAYAQRFTDMTCFTQGDESEFCRYEHALCYDGERLVMSVVEPPTKKMSSNELGHIMGDVMANCYGKWAE